MNSNVDFISPSIMTPCSSPDELVIQQRGRRKIPVIFSPDIDDIKQVIIRFSHILFTYYKTSYLLLSFFFFSTFLDVLYFILYRYK